MKAMLSPPVPSTEVTVRTSEHSERPPPHPFVQGAASVSSPTLPPIPHVHRLADGHSHGHRSARGTRCTSRRRLLTVTNHGPAAVPYTLTLTQFSQQAVCVAPAWAGDHVGAALVSGASRAQEILASCVKKGGGAKVGVRASVAGTVTDPVPDNDSVVRRTKLSWPPKRSRTAGPGDEPGPIPTTLRRRRS
jgi:hypothetical protein